MLFLILIWIAPGNKDIWTYPDVVLSGPVKLKGNASITEIGQDIYGFRALISGLDPYANLHNAVPLIGAEWQDGSPTTHPPTAFLLTAPIAFLPAKIAFAAWAWLMITAIVISLRIHHFSWPFAIILGLLSMLWPPTITSLGNNPCVWMLGLALAYRERNRSPFLAGVWVGVASFTKLLPAGMLSLFLIKKKWSALAGFMFSWGAVLTLLHILSPTAVFRYIEVNKYVSPSWITSIGNGSPLVFLLRYFGLPGLGVGLAVILLMVCLNWRVWLNRDADISPDAWHLFSLLTVIFLPITWTYSIAPLLPGLLILACSNTPKRLLGLLGLAGPVAAVILGLPSSGVILALLIPYCLNWILVIDHSLLSSLSKNNRLAGLQYE